MAHYCFICPDDKRVAGCVERVCCYTPFVRQANHPQRGAINIPDVQATWNWLMTVGYPFPPGVPFQCVVTNPAQGSERTPSVYCVQSTAPAVVREHVNAPTMSPMGNAGAPIQAPPLPGQQRHGVQGAYEPLPDAALAGNADPTFGDIDPAGGTYTDVTSDGQEHPRETLRPYGPPQHGPQ